MKRSRKLPKFTAEVTAAGRSARFAFALAGLAILAAAGANAQESQPNEFVPLPAGTNLALGYYLYGKETSFSVANGPTFTNKTGLQVNIGVARYVHYTEIAGLPAGFQILQPFGSESGGQIGGQSLGSAFGASNIVLSGGVWPYANQVAGRYLAVLGYLYPPTGTYDSHSPLNIGDNRWRGDAQVAWSQAIGKNFSYNVYGDVMLYGDNGDAFPGGQRLSQNPSYRAQVWANWRWTPKFLTAVGYEGTFGGVQSLNGVQNGQKTDEQRLRTTASYFITPALQVLLELNHDVAVVGGFKQQFGATTRFLYAF